jgi:hypothetical protein
MYWSYSMSLPPGGEDRGGAGELGATVDTHEVRGSGFGRLQGPDAFYLIIDAGSGGFDP